MLSQIRVPLSIACLLLVPAWAQKLPTPIASATPNQRAHIVPGYGKLPLAFEENQGQCDSQVKFLSRGADYDLFLTRDEAVVVLHPSSSKGQRAGRLTPSHPAEDSDGRASSNAPSRRDAVMRMKLLRANPQAAVSGQDELAGKSNYFIGRDPAKWRTGVRQFGRVRYSNVYPGVDLVYYGNRRELEYDFVLQAGANPGAIRLGIESGMGLRVERGDLVLTSEAGEVRLRSPEVYQEKNGIRQQVRGRYVIRGKNEVGFEVARYDRHRALVIDPVLAYSTYLGGGGFDGAAGIALDSAGNIYVTGTTSSTDFPTINPIQHQNSGYLDVFVLKLNADGSALLYSTYLGGSYFDYGNSIAVDGAGNAYITGEADSPDFPTVNAIQPAMHGFVDAFVSKLNANGDALLYSTYLGGNDGESNVERGYGIAIDLAGNAYVVGTTHSPDFPTVNPIQLYGGGYDGFVAKFNANGTALVYSTYLGGGGDDVAIGIAVDSARNAYVVGSASSTNFPTVNAFQPVMHGGGDAFVAKLNVSGNALVYSSYLGGSGYDQGVSIAVDSTSSAYVAGCTMSTDFPTANAIQATFGGTTTYPCGDAFVTKFNANGNSLVYSTYLGGGGGDEGSSIAIDSAGNAYVYGTTASTNFPTKNAIQPSLSGVWDAFVAVINAEGKSLVFSTYLGGSDYEWSGSIALDKNASAYVSGATCSKNFPKTLLAIQTSLKSKCSTHSVAPDGFVAKIALQSFVSVSPAKRTWGPLPIGMTSAAQKATLTNVGSSSLAIRQIYIAGRNPGDFAETDTCGTQLAAGASCTLSVTFTPTTKNARRAVLGISDSDPASPQAIALAGTGTFVSLSAKSLSFGNVPVGTSSSPKAVTLTNVGSSQLNFTGISITGTNPGDFSQINNCGVSIGAGANCTITVKFSPTASGTRSAVVSIYDDGGASPQKIGLKGAGT